MLHVVYLMHPSGLCLLEQKFGELELEAQLVTGLFSAIRDFSSILSKGKGEARVVEMGDFYLTYAASDLIVAAAVVDKEDNRLQILHALDVVIEEFTQRYGETLKAWDGKLVFFSFASDLQNLLEDGRIGEAEDVRPRLKRRLPRLMVKLGQISEQEYKVGSLCDGNRIPEEIAIEVGLPQDDVEVILHRLSKIELIEYD